MAIIRLGLVDLMYISYMGLVARRLEFVNVFYNM